MSGEQAPEQVLPSGSGMSLRRLVRAAAGAVVGRAAEADSEVGLLDELDEAIETRVPESESELELDAAETVLADTSNEIEDEWEPFPARWPTGFTIQREVIFSGTTAGFFENKETQLLLWDMMEDTRFMPVPHVTIAQDALTKQILARRQGVPLTAITSECREVIAKLPSEKYAHITGAKTIGSGSRAVALDLDWEGRGRLLQDVRYLCEYFEVPFDTEHKAAYYPHVTVLRALDKQRAHAMADRLNEHIAHTEPKPTAIGFGNPVPLLGR